MNAAVIDVAFGSAEISGGTIKGNVYGITAESGAKSVTVEGEADVYGYYAAINSLNDANVNLSGGTFSSIGSKQTFKTINGGAIGALLADGYAFYDENGVLVDRNTSSSSFTENVSVLEGLVPVKYIDKNGNEASVTNYTSLTGDPGRQQARRNDRRGVVRCLGRYFRNAELGCCRKRKHHPHGRFDPFHGRTLFRGCEGRRYHGLRSERGHGNSLD